MTQHNPLSDLQKTGQYLKVVDVAQLAQVSPSQIYALVKNGSLRAVKFGAAIRIRLEDLEEFIRANLTDKEA
jgi:excisionase family DNA binding protein